MALRTDARNRRTRSAYSVNMPLSLEGWQMRLSRAAVIILALCLITLCAACSGNRVRRPVAGAPTAMGDEDQFEVFAGEYENTPFMVKNPPDSLAVLPFGGDPSNWQLAPATEDPRTTVRRGIYNHVAGLPFTDQELFDTDARLATLEINNYHAAAAALDNDPRRLYALLGVDAVIIGEVTHFDRTFAGVVSQAAVGCTVRMVALPSGELLWRAVHVSRGFGGGVSITPIGLAMSALSSLWNLREEQLLREADTLFREMAATIRVPDTPGIARTAPHLTLFTVEGGDAVLREGDPLGLRIVGTPGARATAHLTGTDFTADIDLRPAPISERRVLRGQLLAELDARYREHNLTPTPEDLAAAMRELDALEIYQGVYHPRRGVQADNVSVHGILVSAAGGRSVRVHPRPLAIDAAPPAAPETLSASAEDKRVRLSWPPVDAADLAAYEIWTSPRGLTGFTLAATSESPQAVLEDLPNFTPLFIRVTAVDAAGNRSGFSPGAKAEPLPASGLQQAAATGSELGGYVDGPLYLPRAFSPYLVRRDLIIRPGGSLHAAPGVVLRFAQGTRLAVEGGEAAFYGSPDTPVRLVPETPISRPGSWHGMEITSSPRAVLHHTRILGARKGLTVADAAPRLHGVAIRSSSQAGLILRSGAHPDVTCSLIKGNGGMGGVVTEGTGLGMDMRQSTFAGNTPFDVQNYSATALDLRNNFWAGPDGPSVLGPTLTGHALDAPHPGCPAP